MKARSAWMCAPLILCAGSAAAGKISYKVTDLGNGSGSAINASGQVTVTVGGLSTGVGYAFLYSNGVASYLGTLPGLLYSDGAGINASGQVTGSSFTSPDAGVHAFLYSGGKMVDLGTLSTLTGSSSEGLGINASGQVTGRTDIAGNILLLHAFLYSDGKMVDLGTLGGFQSQSSGSAINDSGQVAGYSGTSGGYERAFIYSNGLMSDLGTLGGSYSGGLGINASGQVTGSSSTPGDFIYHAFLYSNSVMTDLNTLIDPNLGITLESGVAINDQGQIVANGITSTSDNRAYLLTPALGGVDANAVPDWNAVSADYNPQFVIAAAWGGVSRWPANLILSTAPAGISKAAYFALNPSLASSFGTPEQQFAIAQSQVGSEMANLSFIALDVEQAPGIAYPSDPASVSARIEWFERGIDAIQNTMCGASKCKAVIYTRHTDWDQITGLGEGTNTGTTSFGCLPLWDIQYDNVASLSSFTGYGGWQSRGGKQYAGPVVPPGSFVGVDVDLDVFNPSIFSGASCAKALDETTATTVSRSGFQLNHATRQFVQTVSVTNSSTASIPGPISVALDALSASATLANVSGTTSCTFFAGSPFINVQQAGLAQGQSATVTLQFNNPTNQGIVYSPRILAGPGTR